MTKPPEIATLLVPERFREIVVSSLVEGRVLQTDAQSDAQPSDLAVDLLRTLPNGPVRKSILAGVRDVWILIQQAVVQPDCDPDASIREGSEPLSEIISHFGALLNRAAPPELEALPYSLLHIVLLPEADPVLYDPLVRAALAYARNEKYAPFWEAQAADTLVPEWAFKALLQIDPLVPRIEMLLVDFWIRKFSGESDLDPVYLMADARKARGVGTGFIARVLRRVAEIEPSRLAELTAELDQHSWSRPWLQHLHSPTPKMADKYAGISVIASQKHPADYLIKKWSPSSSPTENSAQGYPLVSVHPKQVVLQKAVDFERAIAVATLSVTTPLANPVQLRYVMEYLNSMRDRLTDFEKARLNDLMKAATAFPKGVMV